MWTSVMWTCKLWTYKLWTLFCGYGWLLSDLSLIYNQLECATLAPTHPQIASTLKHLSSAISQSLNYSFLSIKRQQLCSHTKCLSLLSIRNKIKKLEQRLETGFCDNFVWIRLCGQCFCDNFVWMRLCGRVLCGHTNCGRSNYEHYFMDMDGFFQFIASTSSIRESQDSSTSFEMSVIIFRFFQHFI